MVRGVAGQSSIQILHVDDEETQRFFVKSFLEELNPEVRVTSVDSPYRLMEMLRENSYDCVISDFQMPEMNGVDLAKRVRKFSGVPFVLYTGQGSEEVAEQAFEAGITYYVRKENGPSHYQVLEKSIESAVEKHRIEEQFKRRERELSWMVENSPDAMFRIEYAHGVTRFNPAFLRLFGFTAENTPGSFTDLIGRVHPDDREAFAFLDAVNEVFLEQGIEFRWRSGASWIWVEMNVIPLISDTGLAGMEVLARDITARKSVEHALRHRLDFEQTLNRVTSLFVAFTDVDDSLEKMLSSIGGLLGASRGRILRFTDSLLESTHSWTRVKNESRQLTGCSPAQIPWTLRRLEKGEAVTVDDMLGLTPEAAAEMERLSGAQAHSRIIVPFRVGASLEGMVLFDDLDSSKGLSPADLRLLQGTLDMVGVAIEKKRLLDAQAEQNQRLRGLLADIEGLLHRSTRVASGQ